MAQSILRQIVAGPRARHPEAGLDLCYVTDNIIATSGPSGTYPQRAYRNPLDRLVAFLDEHHGDRWAIWEFRAEGTGYADDAVYNRIWHFPWPDHHPPPFALVPRIMASMRDWHNGAPNRVIVGHCKAGKGRTGTMTVSYLMSEQGWTKADALARFTERRMRPGMGAGVSIPSQLRWIDYVERWVAGGKHYVEASVQVSEVHIVGLRDGVKIAIEGFADEGRKIVPIHTFTRRERDDIGSTSVTSDVDGVTEIGRSGKSASEEHEKPTNTLAGVVAEVLGMASKRSTRSRSRSKERIPTGAPDSAQSLKSNPATAIPAPSAMHAKQDDQDDKAQIREDTIYRPSKPIILPSSDINLAIERRSRAGYGWTLVTSVARVWFNVFFEGHGPEKGPTDVERSGVFSIDWEAMDGIKGSARKGPRAFDRVSVVWSIVKPEPRVDSSILKAHDTAAEGTRSNMKGGPYIIEEPAPGEPVTDTGPANEPSKVEGETADGHVPKRLASQPGLRLEETNSADVSKATSIQSEAGAMEGTTSKDESASEDGAEGVDRGIRLP